MPSRFVRILVGLGFLLLLLAACSMDKINVHTPSATPTVSTSNLPSYTSSPSILQPTISDTITPSQVIPESANIPAPVPITLEALIIDSLGHPMALIPAGPFEMGSENPDYPIEQPTHTVYLDNYYMDLYEVTNNQFARFLNERGNQLDHGESWLETSQSSIEQVNEVFVAKAGLEDHPVIMVRWYGAEAYCNWRGARLPTEAEWEKAARGENGRLYPWGDEFDGSKANYCDQTCEFEHADSKINDGYERTSPIGSFPVGQSPYGLFDMAGNVWEWVADWVSDEYYFIAPEFNPTGPETGQWKVLRGGSWGDIPDLLRASFRNANAPNAAFIMDGFRCARSP